MVSRLLIVAFIIGAVLVIAGTVSALTFDPFRDDVLVGEISSQNINKLFINCPEGFDAIRSDLCFNAVTKEPLSCGDEFQVSTDEFFIVTCQVPSVIP